MALTMKERYARLNMSKLPDDYKKQFDTIKDSTENFSDADLNEVFAENFNDLYDLVESKHPEAINKGTGKVKREKPAKVKKVKGKKEKKEPENEKGSVEINQLPTNFIPGISNLKKKLSEEDIEFIEDQLINNGESTDAEMIAHFVSEVGITEAQAKKWVSHRDKYLRRSVEKNTKYSVRTSLKKEERKAKDIVTTRDGRNFNRKDPSMKGKKFYDENGKQWTCKGYSVKLDECVMEDKDGKEITTCLRDMYVNNPVEKRGKGDMVDDCKDVLSKAGYTVKEHKTGKKKIKRREPRPEKEILKERVQDTFTPITKDLTSSEEKTKENKDVIEALERIQKLFVKLFNRLSNLADDGKADAIGKIEKLLKELVGE